MADYSNAEYYDMIMCVGAVDGNLNAARRLYQQRYIDGRAPENQRRLPSYSSFSRLVNRLHTNGPQMDRPVGRSSGRDSARTEEEILDFFAENPTASTRNASAVLGVSKMRAWRTLKGDRQHPYHYRRTQELTEADYGPRLRFCEWYHSQITDNPNIAYRILWTDEATFTRSGLANIHNEHIWAHENPHAFRENHFQHRWSINVWAGIIGDKLIGPVFLPERLSSQNYLTLLTTTVEEFLEDLPLTVYRDVIFQQDGAPAHYGRYVRDYLNRRHQVWIGRAGPIAWPPRSPDLAPNDFFLWGYLKQIVYRTQCRTAEEMRAKIISACASITPQMLSRVINSVSRRVELCISRRGMHIEPFL